MAVGEKTQLPRASAVPPLEPGDHLSRAEFERRYEAMPHVKKAELIEGVVYMPSPVRHEKHSRPHGWLMGWLMTYDAYTDGVEMGDNATVRLDQDNEPQPDGQLLIQPACGGQTRLVDGYIEGPPELAVEVAASSKSYDLHDKKNAYRRNGVREYVVWRVLDGEIDWFILREGRFESLELGADGILRSETFPGLWLDPEALLARDGKRVLQVLHQGLESPEHEAFIARLRAARESGPAGPSQA